MICVAEPRSRWHSAETSGRASPRRRSLPGTAASNRDDQRGSAVRLTEADLSILWRGQRFPAGALVTRQGVAVRVIFRGRAGRGPGPDFRDAVIAGPSGLTLRGDVELHVRSSLFRAHGHHLDPAYADVVLHVVFEDDLGEGGTPLPGGSVAPIVALAPWVARRALELEQWLVRPTLWREPCHDAVARMGRDAVVAALNAQGDRRFEAKIARMREAIERAGVDQAIYERLLEALGYGGNGPQMLELGQTLPWQRVDEFASGVTERRQLLEALLLGSAGLLPSQRDAGAAGGERYIDQLERIFAFSGAPSMSFGAWKLWGVRPENAPARRIAAAAALLDRLQSPSAVVWIAEAPIAADAVAALSVLATGWWRDHYDVCAPTCRMPPALIGRSRAIEMLLNVVLPAACAIGDAALAEKARTLYMTLPRPAVYGATKFIEEALATDGAKVPMNARRGQGLLELRRNWCTQGGCGRCALSVGSGEL